MEKVYVGETSKFWREIWPRFCFIIKFRSIDIQYYKLNIDNSGSMNDFMPEFEEMGGRNFQQRASSLRMEKHDVTFEAEIGL